MSAVPVGDRPALVDELVLQTGGYPEAELDRMVWLESGWNPAARNPQTSAAGLIQIMPNHLRRWGLTVEQVQAMLPEEQMPLVGRFFREANAFGRWQYPGDTYVAVAAPAFLGRSDDAVAYPVGSKGWKANPAWRSPGNGPVTVGSIRAVLLRGMAGKPGRGKRLPTPQRQEEPYYPANPRSPAPKPIPWGWLMLAGAWWVTRGKRRTL